MTQTTHDFGEFHGVCPRIAIEGQGRGWDALTGGEDTRGGEPDFGVVRLQSIPDSIRKYLRGTYDANAGIDWSRTRAFVLPTDRNSYIRINVRGREPLGTVDDGAEYQAVVSAIDA